MKVSRLLSMLLLGMGITFTSCEKEPEPIPVTGITLDSSSMTLTEGESAILKATISPSNADNQGVIWSSSNSSIASVSNGTVTAVSAGSATITAKSDDGGKTATCNVTVNSKIVAVTGVSLDKSSLELTEGDEYTLVATVQPENADNKKVTWSSSDNAVASVQDGKVTTHKLGRATIIVTTDDGAKTANCEITVKEKYYPVESVTLDKSEIELTEGDETTLTATISPSNATNKNISWISDNEKVATVNDGKVTAQKVGTATITVKTEDGAKTAACKITIKEKVYPVESVTLDKSEIELTEGDEITLTATISPDNATNKNVAWSTNNSGIATVDQNGKVNAIKAGTATITVKTDDGGKTARCLVTVSEPPHIVGLSIKGGEFLFHTKIGEDSKLQVVPIPDGARGDYEWVSTNERVISVTGNGSQAIAHTKDFGSAKIVVTDKRTGLSASEDVRTYVSDFYWDEDTGLTHDGKPMVEIEVGEKRQLKYKCTPQEATHLFADGFIYYEPLTKGGEPVLLTLTPSCFSIDDEGEIEGKSVGLTKIEARSTDLNPIQGILYVNVVSKEVHPSSVSLNKKTLVLNVGETSTLTATINPSNATNKNVSWKSSNTSVATVDASGKVNAMNPGSATITVTTDDGGKTASCSVTVKDATVSVTGVSLNKSSLSLIEGGSETLTATINPSNATNKNVSWSSNNTGVATVKDGIVTAVKVGTATITVKTEDGAKTAACIVYVSSNFISVTGVTVSPTSVEMYEGESSKLTASVQPSNATDKSIVWSSNNEAIASVDQNGNVTAKKTGNVVILATSNSNNNIKGECKVTVIIPSTNISFADATVKSICVSNWDTNADGELSEKEAAAVKSIGSFFKGNTSIETFNEFKYFTGVTKISMAFQDCIRLKSITLPDGLVTIDWYSFDGCSSLQSIDLPSSVRTIESNAFNDCSFLSSVNLGHVTTIGNSAFENCKALTNIQIPSTVTSIGPYAFSSTSLKNVSLPSGISSISKGLFEYCLELRSVSIPESVTSIEDYAFSKSSIESISLPQKLTFIGNYAFDYCSHLSQINIPASVEHIGIRAFEDCSILSAFNCYPTVPPDLGEKAFYFLFTTPSVQLNIYVPSASLDAYKSAGGWSSYANIIKAM